MKSQWSCISGNKFITFYSERGFTIELEIETCIEIWTITNSGEKKTIVEKSSNNLENMPGKNLKIDKSHKDWKQGASRKWQNQRHREN